MKPLEPGALCILVKIGRDDRREYLGKQCVITGVRFPPAAQDCTLCHQTTNFWPVDFPFNPMVAGLCGCSLRRIDDLDEDEKDRETQQMDKDRQSVAITRSKTMNRPVRVKPFTGAPS